MLANLSRISILFTLALLAVTPALARGPKLDGDRHVLGISIEGMHAFDYQNCGKRKQMSQSEGSWKDRAPTTRAHRRLSLPIRFSACCRSSPEAPRRP